MEIQDIKELMEKMSQTGLNLLEFESDGSRLRLEKTSQPNSIQFDQSQLDAIRHMAGAGHQATPPGQQAAQDAGHPAEAARLPAEEPAGQVITSPVVGVFYSAASPDSDPFIKVGSPVETGSPLCIIEAMKLMNEVTSPCDGIILEIMVENGQRVEYGQPLVRIGGN